MLFCTYCDSVIVVIFLMDLGKQENLECKQIRPKSSTIILILQIWGIRMLLSMLLHLQNLDNRDAKFYTFALCAKQK